MSDLLEIAARVLEAVTPPAGSFDADGAWHHTYGVYDLGANLATGVNVVRNPVGTLALTRTPLPGGGAVLDVDLRRRTPPAMAERISGRITCKGDALATPAQWEFSWEAKAGPQTGSLNRSSSRNAPPGACSCNWALFDVVQRLPRNPAAPLSFTLLDEFDLVKPNQRLSYRNGAEVNMASGRMKVHAFEQSGDGVLPVMYWTDEQGRLLFVISGLIAYAIEGDAK